MVGPSVQSKEDGGEEQNPGVVGHPKGPLAAREEEVLEFWNRERIFEKSVEKPSPKGEFVFYDGPPFANGLPHYGHLLASAIKDAIPRYRTMQGYKVERQWGWDCHGLPVENLVEKELGFKGKKDIEDYGIAKFNEAARVSIMKDVEAWRRIIPRMGRWADMERDYKTMDSSYTESVWWAFKTLHGKGLAYEGFKAMHYCPRCGTTLSNFEVAQGYKDIDDVAVTVRLPLIDEPGTSLLVWTTTPWTLPGNSAAAVSADAAYIKVETEAGAVILAKALGAQASGKVVAEFLGKDLVGKRYAPPFDYFKNDVDGTRAWRVYAAPYVTLEDGTGIVHLAPAFGAEDLDLAQKEKIPLIHHVGDDGRFLAKVTDFAGLSVKPKGNPRETDEKVAAALEAKGLLFKKEKITHSYPHCWRCDTPLLNWAANSWFVDVQKIKGALVKENAKVGWVPAHVGEGRFGKWLGGARDWAISRSRYWGAPLPVWRNEKKEIRVIGSLAELLSMAKTSGNRYFLMRHGEAQSNVRAMDDLGGDPENHLTEAGKAAVALAAVGLKSAGIDYVVASPFLRTRETAAIVRQELGLGGESVIFDERLRESGSQDGAEVRRRAAEFFFDLERRYAGKNILIVSHGYPLWQLAAVAEQKSSAEYQKTNLPALASVREASFVPYPHNANYELDLHRPYIDDFDTGKWKRVKDVFDCWFESGSMPFASRGYPARASDFNPKGFLGLGKQGYPADFIAEGLDQTRGWFYSLIVLGTALFGQSPYRNVIVNGIVVAQDGQKMSKRLQNYPDPMDVVEKYGADSLRYFLLSSSVVRGEDLRFSERGVEEVGKKLLMRLDNVRSFLELYSGGKESAAQPQNVLDRWILSRLGQLIEETTGGFERYELDTAARPLSQFIDDLSTWYVRRSRDRFKNESEDKAQAMATLRRVLVDVAKIMAPIMPFFADDLYRRLRRESDPESVHLCIWPEAPSADKTLIEGMDTVRALASEGLKLREKAGIKLRQPLARFTARSLPPSPELRAILSDELNLKEVAEDGSLTSSTLETSLTPELKEEGMYRAWVRRIQEWRKEQGFSIADRPGLLIHTDADAEFLKKYKVALRDATGLLSLEVRIADAESLERL